MNNIRKVNLKTKDIFQINYDIYKSPDQKYDLPTNINPKKPKDLIIRNAYTTNQAKETIRKLINTFPKQEPIVNQIALWVSAFSSLHFFYDANHRTGQISFLTIMEMNKIKKPKLPKTLDKDKVEKLLRKSKETRNLGKQNQIYKKDENYKIWKKYYSKIL